MLESVKTDHAGETLISRSPLNGDIIARYPVLGEDGLSDRLEAARRAQPGWREAGFHRRRDVLLAVAKQLREQKEHLAYLMAVEMGKPVKEGGPEVEKAAWCAEHYAECAENFLARETLASDASDSYVCYEPLGTVLGILPWNAPLWLAFRFLAPALMAGNTCALKHDPHVQGSAQAVIEAFAKAGAPEDIVINLPLATPQVEAAIRHPVVAGVSLTGSTGAGSRAAATAASEIKPTLLELGGSDPCIIMADADLERAAAVAVTSRMINAGQSCIAAKRIIIEASIYDEVTALVRERLENLQMGDPLDPDTEIGPIAREDLRENLHRQVIQTVHEGAECLLGGELPDGSGYFYPPTLLSGVRPGMCAFTEETFGPVMCLCQASDFDEAVALANDTEFGLGAAIWTSSQANISRAVEELVAGQVAVNGIVKTDPRLPSGGVKKSGYGRELGPHGIREFVNAKQVWIA